MFDSKIFLQQKKYNVDTYRFPPNLYCVGFIADLSHKKSPEKELWHFHFDRLVPISQYLESRGIQVFLYSPADVDFKNNLANGYLLTGNKFHATTITTPQVNGDWSVSLRSALKKRERNYKDFLGWIQKYQIRIYSSFEFSNLVSDKNKISSIVTQIDGIKQPESATLQNIDSQVPLYLEKYPMVFIKPQYGSKSERIIVLKKNPNGINFYYYPTKFNSPGLRVHKTCSTIPEVRNMVKQYAINETFLIQQGIEVPRYKNSPVECRVLMVSDGLKWHPFHIIYLGFPDTHISNQPHTDHNSVDTLKVLTSLYGAKEAEKILKSLLSLSAAITERLDKMYPGVVHEMAYDFILDQERNIYFLEVNTKQAMIAPTANLVSPIFNILAEEKDSYDEYLIPHGTILGQFLEQRITEARNEYLKNNSPNIEPKSSIFSL